MTPPRMARQLAAELPASLRAAYIQARQQEAGAEYAMAQHGQQVAATNATHRMGLTLDAQGVHLRQDGAAGQGTLHLVRAGCADHPVAVAAVAPRARGARVEYQRPGLTEWYVYVRQGTVWSEQQRLHDATGEAANAFGSAVALSGNGNTALITAPYKTVGADVKQGQAYVYTRTGTTWTDTQHLIASDGAAVETFGRALALSGNTLLLGALTKAGGAVPGQGRAYVFTLQGTSWAEQQFITASDGAANDRFATALALSGNTALVGAPNLTTFAGKAYVFAPPLRENGVACAAAADCLSNFCADGGCCNTACGGSDPKDCQSCSASARGGTDGTCAPIAAQKQTSCRAATGSCDQAEVCDGASTACPSDQLKAAGTVCRAAPDASWQDALCGGVSATCPENPAVDQPHYEFSGGGFSSCTAAVGASAAPRAAGAAWVLTALGLLIAARRRVRRAPR